MTFLNGLGSASLSCLWGVDDMTWHECRSLRSALNAMNKRYATCCNLNAYRYRQCHSQFKTRAFFKFKIPLLNFF